MSGDGVWMIGPTIYTDDPTKGFGEDGTIWLFTFDGGDHCEERHEYPPWGCALPIGHGGEHMPIVDELLDRGVRAAPPASPSTPENPT